MSGTWGNLDYSIEVTEERGIRFILKNTYTHLVN